MSQTRTIMVEFKMPDHFTAHDEDRIQAAVVATINLCCGNAVEMPKVIAGMMGAGPMCTTHPVKVEQGQPQESAVRGRLMTGAEHAAMEMAAALYNQIALQVIGRGSSRDGDLNELAMHIHGIQNMVLAQAAARAYPGRYRLMGDER